MFFYVSCISCISILTISQIEQRALVSVSIESYLLLTYHITNTTGGLILEVLGALQSVVDIFCV